MYGKKRIVIQKSGHIVLAGGHTWHQIGRAWNLPEGMKGSFLRPEHKYEHQVNPENSIQFEGKTKSELKELVLTNYPEQNENN